MEITNLSLNFLLLFHTLFLIKRAKEEKLVGIILETKPHLTILSLKIKKFKTLNFFASSFNSFIEKLFKTYLCYKIDQMFIQSSSAPHEPILGVTAPLIGYRRSLMICIGLSNAFAINLIMFHPISGVFIMKYKISKFWSILVSRCGSLVVRALGTSPGRSLVRVQAIAFCGKT